MGKRNLRPSLTIKDKEALSPFSFSKNLTNFLQYADGKNDLTKISKLIKRNYKQTFKIYNILKEHKLIS